MSLNKTVYHSLQIYREGEMLLPYGSDRDGEQELFFTIYNPEKRKYVKV